MVRSVRPEPRLNGLISAALIRAGSAPSEAGAQHSATSQYRKLEKRILITPLWKSGGYIDYGSISLTHSHGIGIGRPHHHAFDNGLTTDNQVSFVCTQGLVLNIAELGAGYQVPGARCRVPSAGCQVPGAKCRVPGAG